VAVDDNERVEGTAIPLSKNQEVRLLRITVDAQAIALVLPALVACAGPATPFGAIDSILPPQFYSQYGSHELCSGGSSPWNACETYMIDKLRSGDIGEVKEPHVDISLNPPRQVWHDLVDFSVDVQSEAELIAPEIRVFYNQQDVTEIFLKHAVTSISEDQLSIRYTFRDLQLSSSEQSTISIAFRPNPWVAGAQVDYQEPICLANEQWSIRNTHPFAPDRSILAAIEQLSVNGKLNPSLMAGLIAQESGFEPEAVSWAKAIGLTQVTDQADLELLKRFSDWPRNPDVISLPVPVLKSMIRIGQINPHNEWRLNPERSIQGGIEYLGIVSEYWSREDNSELLQENDLLRPQDYLSVLLASYNSGPARVKSQIGTLGSMWLTSDRLKEARNYVRRIRSYCYHFSRAEDV
jgi:hypothetical protein